jgi:hypothetical protein
MSSEAYVIIRQNQYMRIFRDAGATNPAAARTLAELNIPRTGIFRRLERKEVFKPGRGPETFYMDESAAADFVEARRRRAFALLLLLLVVAAVLFFLGRR